MTVSNSFMYMLLAVAYFSSGESSKTWLMTDTSELVTYCLCSWCRSDGAQPQLVNIQFEESVNLGEPQSLCTCLTFIQSLTYVLNYTFE